MIKGNKLLNSLGNVAYGHEINLKTAPLMNKIFILVKMSNLQLIIIDSISYEMISNYKIAMTTTDFGFDI